MKKRTKMVLVLIAAALLIIAASGCGVTIPERGERPPEEQASNDSNRDNTPADDGGQQQQPVTGISEEEVVKKIDAVIEQVKAMNLSGLTPAEVEEMMIAMEREILASSLTMDDVNLAINTAMSHLNQANLVSTSGVTREEMNKAIAQALATLPGGNLPNQNPVVDPNTGNVVSGGLVPPGTNLPIFNEGSLSHSALPNFFGSREELAVRRIFRDLGLDPDFMSGGGYQGDAYFVRYWTNTVITSVSSPYLMSGVWYDGEDVFEVKSVNGTVSNIGDGQWRVVSFWFVPSIVETAWQSIVSDFERNGPDLAFHSQTHQDVAFALLNEMGVTANDVRGAGITPEGSFFIELGTTSELTLRHSELLEVVWARPATNVRGTEYQFINLTTTPNADGTVTVGDNGEYRLLSIRFRIGAFQRLAGTAPAASTTADSSTSTAAPPTAQDGASSATTVRNGDDARALVQRYLGSNDSIENVDDSGTNILVVVDAQGRVAIPEHLIDDIVWWDGDKDFSKALGTTIREGGNIVGGDTTQYTRELAIWVLRTN